MIVRSRRKNKSLFQRLFGRRKNESAPIEFGVLSIAELELELAKEAARSSRRKSDKEFVLISIHASTEENLFRHPNIDDLIIQFRKRLRISDTIASTATQLFVLLPETNKNGGAITANNLMEIGNDLGIKLDSEIKVYPEDDEVSANSSELRIDSPHHNGANNASSAHDVSDGNESAMAMLAQRPD